MESATESRTIALHHLDPDAEAALAPVVGELGLRRLPPGDSDARANLVVLSALRDEDAAFRLASVLTAGGARVLVVGRKEPDLILRALRAGACEFVVAGDHEELRRAVRDRFSPVDTAARGAVVAVFGAKGGTGATAVATNLAGALQQGGGRVCLVDADPNLGDVLSALDLPAGYALSDLLGDLRRLDRDLLDGSAQRHRSGIWVLAHGEDAGTTSGFGPEQLSTALAFLRGHYGQVVVDGLHGFGELSLAALDASNLLLLVTTQEVTAVRDARRCIDLFRRLGYGDEKLRLVVNRFQRQSRITVDVVAETLGVPVSATLANDYRTVSEAVAGGEIVVASAPRTQLARDLAALAALVAPAQSAAAPRSMLQRLLPRWAVAHGA